MMGSVMGGSRLCCSGCRSTGYLCAAGTWCCTVGQAGCASSCKFATARLDSGTVASSPTSPTQQPEYLHVSYSFVVSHTFVRRVHPVKRSILIQAFKQSDRNPNWPNIQRDGLQIPAAKRQHQTRPRQPKRTTTPSVPLRRTQHLAPRFGPTPRPARAERFR